MAALTLTGGTPAVETLDVTTETRRRVVMPTDGRAWCRIRSGADLYLERIDAADGGSRGVDYETLPAGVERVRYIGRGEFALSGASSSQVVELTAEYEGRADGVDLTPRVYAPAVLTAAADPSSLLVAARVTAGGWIEVDYDDDVAAGDVPSEMVAFDLGSGVDLAGDPVDFNAGNFSIVLEHDDYPPIGCYASLVVAPDASFASNVHAGILAIGVSSSLITYRTFADNAENNPQVINTAGLVGRWMALPLSSTRGAVRGAAVNAYTPTGAYVDTGAAFGTSTDFTAAGTRLYLLVGHSGAAAAGGGTQTYRCRAKLVALPDSAFV